MTGTQRHCEICRKPIDPERCEVLPDTRLCTEHARMIGKYGGEFLVTMRQESLGKQGSLKKNYGGVSTRKTRNTLGIEKLRQEYEDSQGGA
jgi:hypothetical protein